MAHQVRPLPTIRRRRGRHVLSHAQQRIRWHYLGHFDPEGVAQVNCMIGLPWASVFGNPNAASYYVVRIIKFPERRNELAKLRAEIEEMNRKLSVRVEAV